MADSRSTFLIELIVSELKSYVKCKDFIIKSHFADIFDIILEDPNEIQPKKRLGRKSKVRRKLTLSKPAYKTQSGQSVLFTDNIENLISYMKKYPIELSLWTVLQEYKVASTIIPWNLKYIDYLNKIKNVENLEPVSTTGVYNIFDEITSRCMGEIKLKLKFRFLSVEKRGSSIYTAFNSNPSTVLSTVQDTSFNVDDIGLIKTLYGKKKKPKRSNKTKISKAPTDTYKKFATDKDSVSRNNNDNIKELSGDKKVNRSKISLVKSDTDVDKNKQIELMKTKSCSSMDQNHLNIINYIFSENIGPFGNQVYCVNYFTVENEHGVSTSAKSSEKSSPQSSQPEVMPKESKNSQKPSEDEKSTLRKCDKDCVRSGVTSSTFSLDIPKELAKTATLHKCTKLDCNYKKYRKLPTPPDDSILLDLTDKCCQKGEAVEKVEQVTGGVVAKMTFGEKDPCYCECWCDFGFTKKTRYCKVCGGYEIIGEDLGKEDEPFPCPIYHNLEKPKVKASITSDTKKLSKSKSVAEETKKKKSTDKFKFNYGYTAPHIGHDDCAQPCSGTLSPVPKKMGWLWTAENVPGMKFRPLWKPGAVNKHVLRLLRMAKHPGEGFTKKKRKKDLGKSKRNLKRPLLVVHKKDGEYTIEMETMKSYNKPRAINQAPFEDKDPLTYTIGRTEAENLERRLKKERAQRRLERCQREFIQSAFKDMCEEICLKTYQQALGILPDAEDPDCTCYPADPGPDRTDLNHSCSCSEDSQLSFSDTDSDEWIVEFTPPTATYDPTYKSKKVVCSDNATQYTYMDYRVKLLDRYGNPVPRFFKGLDGSELCSDLGGFWGPDGKWLEINVDGFVGPDGKWCPNVIIGPNGEKIEAEIGKFQDSDGKWLVIGIDGFVDVNGKWRPYHKQEAKKPRTKAAKKNKTVKNKDNKKNLDKKKSEGTWSCFGDATPEHLSKLGILGHGHDRKLLLDTLNRLIEQGENVQLPKPTSIPRKIHKGKAQFQKPYDEDKVKCKHARPSSKGVIAMDGHGNKIYFRLNESDNRKRSKQRLVNLAEQGISVSSFHMPCFHSFISNEVMKKELYDRRVALAEKHGYVPKTGPRHVTEAEQKYRNMIV